jgi:hypothetical protein
MIVDLFKMCGKEKDLELLDKTTSLFRDLRNSYGECQPYANIVRIHQGTWHFLAPIEKLELLLHEVGHCALLMDHRENSIMQTTGFLSGDFYMNFDHYMNEYFQCKDCCNIPKDFL